MDKLSNPFSKAVISLLEEKPLDILAFKELANFSNLIKSVSTLPRIPLARGLAALDN